RKHVDFEFFWETCGDWYEDKDIKKEEFRDFPLSNGFNTGDIIVLRGFSAEDIEIGDVVVFYATKNFPIIHRVVEKEEQNGEYVFTTKGDHNKEVGPDDMDIKEEDIIGKASLRIPYLGWVKLSVYKLLHMVI
ncbi:MAG: signal peptidase I, partial [Nanoarchaeota archaeon]